MSEQKKYDTLKCDKPAFAGAGDYLVPTIELQPIEVKRLGEYGRIRRAFLQEYNPMLFNDLGADGAVVSASV